MRLEGQGPEAGSLVQGWVWTWFDRGSVCPGRRRAGRWQDESGSSARHKLEARREPAGGSRRNQADIRLLDVKRKSGNEK